MGALAGLSLAGADTNVTRGKEPNDEDLFLEAMQDVSPVAKGRHQKRASQSKETPGRRQRREDAAGANKPVVDPNFLTLGEVEAVAPLAFVEWKKDGVQNAVFRKLKQGGYVFQSTLDLHRKTVKEARQLLLVLWRWFADVCRYMREKSHRFVSRGQVGEPTDFVRSGEARRATREASPQGGPQA